MRAVAPWSCSSKNMPRFAEHSSFTIDHEPFASQGMAASHRRNARWRDRQAPRFQLPHGRPPRHAEDQNFRSADCVVGGFRYNENSPLVGSLLLGLYDRNGRLNHVGFTSTIKREDKPAPDQKPEIVGWSARLHRQCAWRPEPLGHQAISRIGAAKAKACRGSLLRPFHRRAVQTCHTAIALAPRQGAKAVHHRSDQAEESKTDGAA